jgi:WD40 repeat protein
MGKGKCHVEMSADGRFIAAGGADGTVVVWDVMLPAGAQQAGAGGTASPRSSSSGGGAAPAGAAVLRHHRDAVVACAWSSDCTTLVSGDKAGQLAFWQCTA